MGSSDDDDDDDEEADENYGHDITDDENDNDSDHEDDDEFADFIASQEATKYDNYNDYDNNTDIHQTNNDDEEEQEDIEDEDEEEDIVMQLEFTTMSKEKEQLFTDIIKEEEEKMNSKNSDTNNTPTNRVKSRRRSSVAFSTTDVNSTVVDDGDNNNHNDTSTPDSDQQRRQRRSSIISLRPSLMSKETAEKVIALLSMETEDDEEQSTSAAGREEEKKNTTSNNNKNNNEKDEDNNYEPEQKQEVDWDDLSLEKKLNKIKCAAAGGGLVLLGIITTPTPLPTLPFIAAGFHILGQEYEQAKAVEDQLMEKVDSAKTTVMQKYEEYTTHTTTNDPTDQEDEDKDVDAVEEAVDGSNNEEANNEDVVEKEEKKDIDTNEEEDKEEDEEFSDFIVSQWKDHVEIGLRIQYPLPCTKYLVTTTTNNATTHEATVNTTNTNIDTATEVELEGVILDNQTEATATATTTSEIEVRTNKHVYEVVLNKKIAAIAAQLEIEDGTTKDVDNDSVHCENGDTFPDPPHNEHNEVTRHRLPVLQLSTRLEEQSMAPLFDGTQWAGTRIWKAAVLGLEYIIRLRLQQQQQQSRPNADTPTPTTPTSHNSYSSLLELGCGLGVPGMIWKQLLLHEHESSTPNDSTNTNPRFISPRVVLTDRDSLLVQLQTNLEHNFGGSGSGDDDTGRTDTTNTNIVAKAFAWSTAGLQQLLEEEQQHNNKTTAPMTPLFDICLNCDCIYEPLYGRAAWEALADVLIALATQSPHTLLVTSVERRNSDNVEGFLHKLTTSGVVEVPIECVVHDDSDPYHIIEIYTTKGISNTSSTSNVR